MVADFVRILWTSHLSEVAANHDSGGCWALNNLRKLGFKVHMVSKVSARVEPLLATSDAQCLRRGHLLTRIVHYCSTRLAQR